MHYFLACLVVAASFKHGFSRTRFQGTSDEFKHNLKTLSLVYPDAARKLTDATTGDFERFVVKHGKTYKSDAEKRYRLKVFQENMLIAQMQEMLDLGTAKYGMTPFSDLTPSEFKKSFRTRLPAALDIPVSEAVIPTGSAPLFVDWRKRGAVTAVKNQGWVCGACWAFSTIGSVEGQWFLKTGNLVSFSEQELIDCDTIDYGCRGGNPSSGFRALVKIGGIETEKKYPYDASTDSCSYSQAYAVAYINGSQALTKNEDDMAAWCAQNGPISIGINADGMQNYVSGISRPRRCDPTQLDHAVLLVGYGLSADDGIPYWIIKNSYGPTWGEDGYYRLYRGDGTCGVDQEPLSALIY